MKYQYSMGVFSLIGVVSILSLYNIISDKKSEIPSKDTVAVVVEQHQKEAVTAIPVEKKAHAIVKQVIRPVSIVHSKVIKKQTAPQGMTEEEMKARIDKIQARRPGIVLDEARLHTVLNAVNMPFYDHVEKEKAFESLPYLTEKQKTDGRNFITYEPYLMETKFVGDKLSVYLPNLSTKMALTITDVTVNELDGIVRWVGEFDGFLGEKMNKFSVTQAINDEYAVSTIVTPFGSYNLESKDGYGWVVSQKTDFFLPKDGSDTIEGDV